MIQHFRILIVDDNNLMRLVMKGYLYNQLMLPRVVETSNLCDTFALLSQQQFDFLLLDINMPNGDSKPDTIRKILSIQPDIKICMFSGNEKLVFEEPYLSAGAVGFIQKDEDIKAALEEIFKNIFK